MEDPEALASLARGRLADKHEELVRALHGLIWPHQRLLLAEQLDHLAELDARVERLSAETERRMAPFAPQIQALETIPGVGVRVAEEILAEIGPDMSRFPSSRHLASWAKICPGNHQSAGKHRKASTRHGNKWLRYSLTEAAKAAARKNNCYLQAQFRHLKRRTGSNIATLAVAHSILTIAYHLLHAGGVYENPGPTYFDERARNSLRRRLVNRLENLGFDVAITDRRAA